MKGVAKREIAHDMNICTISIVDCMISVFGWVHWNEA